VGDPSEEAPGWDAIDSALVPIYGDTEPKHYGTVVPGQAGGDDPLAGISVYVREMPEPHFHFVTYGFTELWDKESDDEDTSGFGFELTFRLAREESEEEPPSWALHFLQNLGRYVFRTGNAFAAGHKMGLNGPIALGQRTALTAVCFAPEPELGEFSSINGAASFLQIVGITDDEYRLAQDWSSDGLIELLATQSPLLITDLWRASILDEPRVAQALRERVDRDGSSEASSFAGDLSYDSDGSRVVMTLGALYAPAIRRAMSGRIRHRRSYQLLGRTQAVTFEPGEAAWRIVDGRLVLGVPPSNARQIAAQVSGRAGRYELAIPGVTLVVAPTYIRDQSGRVIDVKGVEPSQAEELAAAENAKLAPFSEKKRSPAAATDKRGAEKPGAEPRARKAPPSAARPVRVSPGKPKATGKATPSAKKAVKPQPKAAKGSKAPKGKAVAAKPKSAARPAGAAKAAKGKPAGKTGAARKVTAKAKPKPRR
jgi:suppressor of fused